MIVCSVHQLLCLFSRYSCLSQRRHLTFVYVKDGIGEESKSNGVTGPFPPSRDPVVISPPRLVLGQVETATILQRTAEVHRFPILELERLRYSIKSSTSGAPKIRR
ncbi:unnamed protein product, partial [Cyprideis torosa]